MIKYIVKVAPSASDFFLKLPMELQNRITKKLGAAAENPAAFFIQLRGRHDYKLRIGDYRIIAEIDNNKRLIEVTKIGHRKNIYKFI